MQTITILATFQQPQNINVTTPTSGTNPATRLNVRQVLLEDLPVLEAGELAFTTDEKSLYVGAEEGNQRFLNENQIIEQAVSEHTHSESDITDLDKYTKAEIDQLLIENSGAGADGASIVSAVFEGDDIVFTKDDASTVILTDAKVILKGDQGDGGQQGLQGENGNDGADGAEVISVAFVNDDMVFTKSDDTTFTLTDAKIDLQGADGNDGDNGIGVPEGGTAGQVLSKIDGTDYNTEWVEPSGGDGVSGIKALKLAFISL